MDPAMLADLLRDILHQQNLKSLFQPIVDLGSGRIYGYEALLRGPSDSPLHSPTSLFTVAERCGRMAELDQLARTVHIRNFAALDLPGKLFLNVFPGTLLDADFRIGLTRQALQEVGLSPGQVVIELTEHFPIDDYDLVRHAMTHYRQMGFAVAIDDLGAGYAGLRLWSELRPDFVKFDRHFIQGIDTDPVKDQFVRSLQEIAAELGCRTIAEGIETASELATVARLGVGFGQGYRFARPQAIPVRSLNLPARPWIALRQQTLHTASQSRTAACLVREVPTVRPEERITDVAEIFSASPALQSLPVVDGNGIPVGLLARQQLMNILGSRYGRDLYGRDPVAKFMEVQPLVIEKDQPLEELSQFLTRSADTTAPDDFIIADQGRYLGTATVLSLLREITDLQIRHARHANPLTLLPGNVPLNEHLEHLLRSGEDFAACYCDLDHFKPYNDHYGYRRGDQVICLLSRLLVEAADSRTDFVGHIGGDDFMVVFRSADWQERCRALIARFDAEIVIHYDPLERHQGGFYSEGREGSRRLFPFVSLSIGAVHSAAGPFDTCHAISAAAGEVKHQAKKIVGSCLFVDRRSRVLTTSAEPARCAGEGAQNTGLSV